MTDRPKRPRWRKKRWLAAVLLWLAFLYPLSSGPFIYFVGREWVGPGPFAFVYTPLLPVLRAIGLERPWQEYNLAAWETGRDHRLAGQRDRH